jgi:hypothetical protein
MLTSLCLRKPTRQLLLIFRYFLLSVSRCRHVGQRLGAQEPPGVGQVLQIRPQ